MMESLEERNELTAGEISTRSSCSASDFVKQFPYMQLDFDECIWLAHFNTQVYMTYLHATTTDLYFWAPLHFKAQPGLWYSYDACKNLTALPGDYIAARFPTPHISITAALIPPEMQIQEDTKGNEDVHERMRARRQGEAYSYFSVMEASSLGQHIYSVAKEGTYEAATSRAIYSAGHFGWSTRFTCVVRTKSSSTSLTRGCERVNTLWELLEAKDLKIFY